MESRFSVVGRTSVRLWDSAPPPRRGPDAFPPSKVAADLPPAEWRRSLRPLLCLAAFALALWPHWRWAAMRLGDGSDDPLGLAALAVLAVAIARLAPRLRAEPAPGWLALAVLLTALATVLGLIAPALLAAVLAALAFAAALAAFAPAGTPVLPLAGLATLALPVVSSLQFYAGYPLRLVTAEASRWLLGLAGFDASREGSAMLVDGRLVIVDAPCSGVQMVWMAWFCACCRRLLARPAGPGLRPAAGLRRRDRPRRQHRPQRAACRPRGARRARRHGSTKRSAWSCSASSAPRSRCWWRARVGPRRGERSSFGRRASSCRARCSRRWRCCSPSAP